MTIPGNTLFLSCVLHPYMFYVRYLVSVPMLMVSFVFLSQVGQYSALSWTYVIAVYVFGICGASLCAISCMGDGEFCCFDLVSCFLSLFLVS